jgi:hypothetical protein
VLVSAVVISLSTYSNKSFKLRQILSSKLPRSVH